MSTACLNSGFTTFHPRTWHDSNTAQCLIRRVKGCAEGCCYDVLCPTIKFPIQSKCQRRRVIIKCLSQQEILCISMCIIGLMATEKLFFLNILHLSACMYFKQ